MFGFSGQRELNEAATGPRNFADEFSKVRFLDLIEATASIFCRVLPGIGLGADKGARWRVVAVKLYHLHRDNFVNDRREFARGTAALHLESVFSPIKVVDYGLKDSDEHDIERARLLKMKEPGAHLARVQSVSAAQIALTGSF